MAEMTLDMYGAVGRFGNKVFSIDFAQFKNPRLT